MNDYHLCWIATKKSPDNEQTTKERLTAHHTNHWHRKSVQWLADNIKAAAKRTETVVVLTHHTPSTNGTSNPIYKDDREGLNCCFSTDLTHLLQPPAVTWACGHTHWNFDMTVPNNEGGGGVRLCSNQRGYPGQENIQYDNEGLVIEVAASKTCL